MTVPQTATLKSPRTLWAQRIDKVLLTIELPDCKEPQINITDNKLHFKGKSEQSNEEQEVIIEFYEQIKSKDSSFQVKDRGTEFVLAKEKLNWWPRLLKDTLKHHWLAIDFKKWQAEDDSDDEAAPGGMPGMPGMPGGAGGDFTEFMRQMQMSGQMPDLGEEEDDLQNDKEDSDDDPDDQPPELS